jgi:hypothetical protein
MMMLNLLTSIKVFLISVVLIMFLVALSMTNLGKVDDYPKFGHDSGCVCVRQQIRGHCSGTQQV